MENKWNKAKKVFPKHKVVVVFLFVLDKKTDSLILGYYDKKLKQYIKNINGEKVLCEPDYWLTITLLKGNINE